MKNLRSQRGQSLVELSVSLVLLLILLSGAVEFGIAFFQFVQLRDAAQEGALYGSMNPSQCANIESRIKYASRSPIDMTVPGIVTITTNILDKANNEYPCGSAPADPYDCEGNGLKVDIRYNHKIFMPFLPQIISSSTIPLHATVTDTILSP